MKTMELSRQEEQILVIALENWELAQHEGDIDPILERLAGRSTILATLKQLLSDMRQDPTWTPGCHQREVLAVVRTVSDQLYAAGLSYADGEYNINGNI
jgi:hypothetical protein